MAQTFVIKEGDTGPDLECTLEERNGTPRDLTGYLTCEFSMKREGLGSVKIDGANAVVDDEATGSVRYEWSTGDTNVPGRYLAEFHLTFPGGERVTWPATLENDGYIIIEVQERVGTVA